ncbi:hypothetical protein C8259_16890 [Nocardia nova]|uniref:Uncharacterized protein n=1 Tax=Nocardia nova TaxID=37330 RepID=A0A2T2Z273_9NOCA|nr:hypothetical protein C8259_16890 [Nocardia nova]
MAEPPSRVSMSARVSSRRCAASPRGVAALAMATLGRQRFMSIRSAALTYSTGRRTAKTRGGTPNALRLAIVAAMPDRLRRAVAVIRLHPLPAERVRP